MVQSSLFIKRLKAKRQRNQSGNFRDKNDVFTFSGLDDGDYVLKETKTPDEYNTANDIAFQSQQTTQLSLMLLA